MLCYQTYQTVGSVSSLTAVSLSSSYIVISVDMTSPATLDRQKAKYTVKWLGLVAGQLVTSHFDLIELDLAAIVEY